MKPPVRLAHVVTDLDVGGAEMMLVRLLSRLDRTRFDNQVISLLPAGPLARELAAMGIAVSSLNMRRGSPDPVAVIRLRHRLRALRPAVVQTWLYHADVLGLIAARLAGVPQVVWNIRTSAFDIRAYGIASAMTRRLGAMLSSRPAAVVVNSTAGWREHERLGYRPRRWVLIPNGIDTEVFSPDRAAGRMVRSALGIQELQPVVGMIARFDPLKGHARFIHAAAQVASSTKDAVFVLAGRGVDPANAELRNWISAVGLQQRFHLLGERMDVPAILAALDLYVMASETEGFPNAVAEAMACGIPCVATDVGDARVLIADTGWVVSSRDPEALGAAVRAAIAGDAAGRVALGRAARQRICDEFSLVQVVARYAELYESLSSGGTGRDGNSAV